MVLGLSSFSGWGSVEKQKDTGLKSETWLQILILLTIEDEAGGQPRLTGLSACTQENGRMDTQGV